MALIKVGESSVISSGDIQSPSSVLAEMGNDDINAKFSKFAQQLKRVAPKADDFLYFTAVMITAAEASALNEDGSLKKRADGSDVEVGWDVDEKTGSWKWRTNDDSIQAYANANGDIFPEAELLKAYKKWAGKPLCVDHQSSNVDAVRGIILDVYYDRVRKQAIGLVAADKVAYPELCRGITTGYKTNVSMGTAVGKAVCYNCGTVARNEREFCHHMQTKSAKEINTELSPIELSVVTTGADSRARVRTILAAANHLRQNIEEKSEEIAKLAVDASSMTKFKELEDDLQKLSDKMKELKTSLEKEETDQNSAAVPSNGTSTHMPTGIQSDKKTEEDKSANNHAFSSELQDIKASVSEQFAEMNETLKSLSHKIHEEMKMANSKQPSDLNKEAYYQSGNKESDPTPGKPKYVTDPMGDKIRLDDNKWQQGHMPIVLDGLHGSDLELKKKHLRAELEQRQIRRAAAIKQAQEKLRMQKEAYYQSGDNKNDPTPGKIRYLADKEEDDLRKKDLATYVKHDVGDVSGLFVSPGKGKDEEAKLRKKLLRANEELKAKFVRVADENGIPNFDKSGWQVSQGDELLFTASIKEIAGTNSRKLYDTIATRNFAKKLLAKVQSVGIEKAAAIYKSAQDAGMTPPAAPDAGAPPMDMGAPPTDMGAPGADDTGADGDPKETAVKLAEEMRDRASDLLEAVRLLTGEQAEMGDVDGLAGKAATLAPLFKMKRSLGSTLVQGLKHAIATLDEHQQEMHLVSEIADAGLVENVQQTVVQDAFTDATKALDDTRKIMASYVSYVRGSEKLHKQANALAVQPVAPVGPAQVVDSQHDNHLADDLGLSADELPDDPELNAADDDVGEDEDENMVMMDVDPKSLENKKVEVKASNEPDLLSKEGRAQMRAKLAAQVLTFDPILDAAHKVVDYTPVPGSRDLAEFETIDEAQKKDVEIATMQSVRVRKEAERLHALVTKGTIKVSDFEKLAANGLDPAVLKYYKELYEIPGDKATKEFAEDLARLHSQAKLDEEVSKHKIKISRAYELANEMVRCNMLPDNMKTIASFVDKEILAWNDEGFESMKRIVAKTPVKTASKIPQVGVFDGGMVVQAQTEETFRDQLDQALAYLMPGRR